MVVLVVEFLGEMENGRKHNTQEKIFSENNISESFHYAQSYFACVSSSSTSLQPEESL